MNARGFKQFEGQHYDSKTMIKIVLTLMVMASMIAHAVDDIKGAF
jgi:hypothetical protein